jgi:hypothetical protein
LIRRITITCREEGEGEGVVGCWETAQGVMAILVVADHITTTVCERGVAVVPQCMAGPIMALGIGPSLIVTGTVAGITTERLLLDMVVVDPLEVVVVVAGGDYLYFTSELRICPEDGLV